MKSKKKTERKTRGGSCGCSALLGEVVAKAMAFGYTLAIGDSLDKWGDEERANRIISRDKHLVGLFKKRVVRFLDHLNKRAS